MFNDKVTTVADAVPDSCKQREKNCRLCEKFDTAIRDLHLFRSCTVDCVIRLFLTIDAVNLLFNETSFG